MTGEVLREATLASATGLPVHVRVIRPDPTVEDVRELRRAYDAWHAQALAWQTRYPEASFHAQFAAEVAFLAASAVHEWAEDPQHQYIVVALSDRDEVLGINTAYWVPEEGAWYLAVGATRPIDQPGAPNPDQVRGIGSQVIGAMLHEMNGVTCARVTLEPLDADARRFWAARGFHDAGEEMEMSCPESQELEHRLAAMPPDCPDLGDCTATDSRRMRAERAASVR